MSARPSLVYRTMAAETLSLDTVLDLLSDCRRRLALAILAAHGGPITLADLADEVAIREHEARIDEIPATEVMEIYLSLYHNHIQKLRAAGIVTYCQELDLVSVSGDLAEVAPLLPEAGG